MNEQFSLGQRTVSRDEMTECLQKSIYQGKELALAVTGHSMSPTLSHLKDSVILVPVTDSGIKRLDIILFRRQNGKYVLHRIIRSRKNGSYLVNGDAQQWTEEVFEEQILAVVGKIVKKGRTIDCGGIWYRMYAFIWVGCRPMRRLIIGFYRQFFQGRKES